MNIAKTVVIFLLLAFPVAAQKGMSGKASPPAILQGGDNISSAFPIPYMPYSEFGTTVGYADDYDGNCGTDNGAPDVVYSYMPAYNEILMISLCQSTNFDSRLYVFEDSPSNIIACNDDECSNEFSDYVSQLNCVAFSPGHTYYIVVDGYGSASGAYSIDFNYPVPAPSIQGTVFDSDSQPIMGATVSVFHDSDLIWTDTTNVSGYYMAFGMIEGYYTVEASKVGYVTQTQGPIHILDCDPAFVDFVLELDVPPCDIIPFPGAVVEDEPICYDEFNDIYNIGCSAEIWDTIPANCTFFGTSGTYILDGLDNRDTDWLEFELRDSSTVQLEGMAEFAPQVMFIKQGPVEPCLDLQIMNFIEPGACAPMLMTSELSAGQYWIWIAPADFSGVDCGLEYQFVLTSTPYQQCNYVGGDINNSGAFNGIDVTYGVSYFKGGPPPPYSCFCHDYVWYVAGDFNGDCQFNGLDITYMVGFLKGFWPWHFCPDCPPTGR